MQCVNVILYNTYVALSLLSETLGVVSWLRELFCWGEGRVSVCGKISVQQEGAIYRESHCAINGIGCPQNDIMYKLEVRKWIM